MHRAIDVIDNFYTQEQLDTIFDYTSKTEFSATLQPYLQKENYASRFQAYPCHESEMIDGDTMIFRNLHNNLTDLDYRISKINTFFRKIYKKEIEKSICVNGIGFKHKDNDVKDGPQVAGLIYLDKKMSLNSGTKLYTEQDNYLQHESDIHIGSKFNRCIIYNGSITHQALYDLNIESRFIQPFFIKVNEEN